MRHVKFLALALFSVSTMSISAALAQSSLDLGAKLTVSDGTTSDKLGVSVAISGDTIVAGQNGCLCIDLRNAAYVFQKQANGWTSETETAKLDPATEDILFAESVGISGDTVVASGKGKAYIFVKAANGWASMTETAQLLLPEDAASTMVAIDGDTVAVSSRSASYVFVKPTAGWSTTSAYQAKIDAPEKNIITSAAISGNTLVMGFSYDPDINNSYPGLAYVFQKPESGWETTRQPTAKLSGTNAGTFNQGAVKVAVYGDTIAASVVFSGMVNIFVKPASGWTDISEAAVLNDPELGQGADANLSFFGIALALDDSHLLAGSQGSAFVYSKPTSGWKSGAWPSQQFAEGTGPGTVSYSYLGEAVALQGANVIAADVAASGNGHTFVGAVYAFPLFPNSLQLSTNLLEFPDINLNDSEVMPLTVTNVGTGTLNLTTSVDRPNYQVLQTSENTCRAGVPAGQSCVLPIEFTPNGVGEHTNHLTVSSPSSASIRIILLRGTAVGVGAATNGTLGHFFAAPGKTEMLPLVLANFGISGSPTVALSFSNPAYSLGSAGTCAAGVPEGKTCTMMIKFAPATTGTYNAEINLKPSSGPSSVVKTEGASF